MTMDKFKYAKCECSPNLNLVSILSPAHLKNNSIHDLKTNFARNLKFDKICLLVFQEAVTHCMVPPEIVLLGT